jgi:hypothetical protein
MYDGMCFAEHAPLKAAGTVIMRPFLVANSSARFTLFPHAGRVEWKARTGPRVVNMRHIGLVEARNDILMEDLSLVSFVDAF